MARPGMPMSPLIEELLTMAPPPCFRIWSNSYFMQSKTLRRLIAFTRSEFLTGGISSFNGEAHDTGVVERRIQPPKCRNGLLDHRLHLSFIGDIGADSYRLMAGSDQALGGYPHCRFIDVNQRDRSTLCCKCLRRRQAHTGACPGD